MCNCAKEAYELINREHGNAEIDMEGMLYRARFDKDSMAPTDQFMVCCYSYRKRNKNGDYCESTKSYIFYPYCPFCGKKYDFGVQKPKTNK
jgi:hypothetical protein